CVMGQTRGPAPRDGPLYPHVGQAANSSYGAYNAGTRRAPLGQSSSSIRSAIESTIREGRYGWRSASARVVTPVSTRIASRPASSPDTTSVSIRSPIIAAVSEWASIAFRAERIISGFGLPTKYGAIPVARVISAATDPVAGSGPSGDGPVGSGFVAMNRAPPVTSRMALVMRSKL